MKAKLQRFMIWAHVHAPTVAMIVDRILHSFGFCIGH